HHHCHVKGRARPMAGIGGRPTEGPMSRRVPRRVSGLRAILTVVSALVLLGAGGAGPAAAQAAAPVQENSSRPESLQPGDAFGEEVNLPEQTIIFFSGTGQWDNAFETIVDGFKAVNGYLKKAGIKPAGPPMTIYTSTNDTSFQFRAAFPLADPPKAPPTGDIAVAKTSPGKAYKFIHRG